MEEQNTEQSKSKRELTPESNYTFAKCNVQAEPPSFTDDEYNTTLKSEGWTLDETRYLLDLYREFYGKWPIIIDRYDYNDHAKAQSNRLANGHKQEPAVKEESTPINDSGKPTPYAPTHSLEDLKSHYYSLTAKLMTLRTPLSQMNNTEYSMHDLLTRYNKNSELHRKLAKEKILVRSKEEKREEEHLVAELSRIYNSQEKFAQEMKEVRERLDHSLTDSRVQSSTYQSSAEIAQLWQRLVVQDKKLMKPRRSLTGADGAPVTSSPTTTQGGQNMAGISQHQKRASIAGSVGTSTTETTQRTLSPRAQQKYGVTYHDRLTSGVTFRGEKISKLRQAKSQTQTQKINSILAELEVPELLQMPTTAVIAMMEKLVGKVTLLIDARRLREKEESEISAVEKQIEINNRKPEDVDASTADAANDEGGDTTQKKDEITIPEPAGQDEETQGQGASEEPDAAGDVDESAKEADDVSTLKPEAANTAAGGGSQVTTRNKRSASVLSASSVSSAAGSRAKRQKGGNKSGD